MNQRIAVLFERSCLMSPAFKIYSHSFYVSTKVFQSSEEGSIRSNTIATSADFQKKHDKLLKITKEEYSLLPQKYKEGILQWATHDLTNSAVYTQASVKESAALLELRTDLVLQFFKLQVARQLLEQQQPTVEKVQKDGGDNFFRNLFLVQYFMDRFNPSTPAADVTDDFSTREEENTEEFKMSIDKEELIDDSKDFDDSKEYIKEEKSDGIHDSKEYFKEEVEESDGWTSGEDSSGGGFFDDD